MLRVSASSPLNPCLQQSGFRGEKGTVGKTCVKIFICKFNVQSGQRVENLIPWGNLTGWTGICPLTSPLLISLVSQLDGIYRHTEVCVSEEDLRREGVFLSVGSTILWAGGLGWMKNSSKLRRL